MIRSLLVLFLLVTLASCARVPPLPDVDDPDLAWQQHQLRLEQVTDWRLNGRLLVVNDHETWNTSIHWRQQGAAYQLMITAPLGQGSLRLVGDVGQVTLETHQGERWQSGDPEALLANQLGWRVPVAALRYWVMGLPAPGPHRRELNSAGLLAQLSQGEWEIEFRDYRDRDGLLLPGRVFANNHQARVRLVIGEWYRE